LSRSHLKFEWKEDSSKQKFDKKVPGPRDTKLNYTPLPFIKSLDEKRKPEGPMKIGRENTILLDKSRPLLVKIGHPESMTTTGRP
jgi:hypothetical protein